MPNQIPYFLTEHDLGNLKQWFIDYVHSFSSNDLVVQQALKLKEEHSFRVCSEIINIGKQLHLSPNNLRIAELMALLHDIGRFEQFARYQTYLDLISEDHAKLGVTVLQGKKALAALGEDTQNLILKTISYHNRFKIPNEENHTCLYFSKLLRDADKLAILHLVTTDYASGGSNAVIDLHFPDKHLVSADVIENLNNGKLIKALQIRSLNDFKLAQMGWIYDLNFRPTMRLFRERDYLKKLRETMPASEKIDQVYSKLNSYIGEALLSSF